MEKQFWYQKQLRMLQTVLREPDIENYDAEKVVTYLKDTHSNCIIVNAGGIIDFFQNKTKLARLNSFMTTEDMLYDLATECHKNDIRVIVRVDFRGVEETRYERQPDWFGQNEDGSTQIGWNQMHKPCYNGVYANGHAVEYITELMKRYDIDGVWENSVGFGTGPCYCQTCRERYRRDTGKEIPAGGDYATDLFREYRDWKTKCADDHLKLMRNTVKSFGEEKAYCAEIFGMFHASNALKTGIDLYNAKQHFDFLVSPAFLDGCAGDTKIYDDLTYAASSIRFLKSIDSVKQAVLLTGNNGTKWRYIKAPECETKIWMWEAVSVGASFWNTYFNGQYPGATFDTRNAYIEQEVYQHLKDNESLLKNQIPVKDVGVYYSKYSRDGLGNDNEAKDGYGVFIKGVERNLMNNHIQYNFIPDLELSLDRLKGLKALIIPNGAWLSGEQIEIIKEYVKQGGGLIASYETSLYDENGKRRVDFGLRDLFGCSFTGMKKDTSSDCYQMVKEHHPILNNMNIHKTKLIMNEGMTLLCTVNKESKGSVVCTYVPKIYNQPPEYAWIPDMNTEYPTVMVNEYGKGRIVYFANQTDKLCYTNGHEDFVQLFYNAVLWVSNENLILKTNATESVHITLMEDQQDSTSLILSFVNTTSGVTRPIKQIVPVYDIETDIVMGKKALEQYKILRQENEIKIVENKENDKVNIRIHLKELKEFTSVYLKVK
ncbi:ThuA domain-containing protein [Anaerocolumna sp. MB42-C2]|uniref:ThuA domain-containing protein n=1 Tax=Anaerocolumna sp. MB42-C2 TaxID=3070997 RepID=UPI0027DF9AE1|nr:ThuA domain-containing protein [Anaerocolumna sp. MB42-C2]WMJ89911.1 beta-galactosidase trimerization domain-containing protein [Anaerocolumna sp. MB42-C2]